MLRKMYKRRREKNGLKCSLSIGALSTTQLFWDTFFRDGGSTSLLFSTFNFFFLVIPSKETVQNNSIEKTTHLTYF